MKIVGILFVLGYIFKTPVKIINYFCSGNFCLKVFIQLSRVGCFE